MRHGDGFSTRSRGEIARALQYAGEASGLKYAVVVRRSEEPGARGRAPKPGLADRGPAERWAPDPGASDPRAAAAPQPVRPDTDTWAHDVHARMADPRRSVLVAVDPAARTLRIVTGERSGRRLPDESLAAIATLMSQLFATRGLVPGLVTGLQELGQRAGPPRRRTSATV